MTENKFIRFEKMEWSGGHVTELWAVVSRSSKAHLALILWYGLWRQYVLSTFEDVVFNTGCLKSITEFIEELNRLHKTKTTKRVYCEVCGAECTNNIVKSDSGRVLCNVCGVQEL